MTAINPGSVWIMGLSSAGKSTLSGMLVTRLRENGYPCILLDGDQIRAIFPERLGYDPESRRKQTQRVMAVTQWISSQGILPIVAIIHPFEDDRRTCRETLHNYYEVYLKCSLQTCRSRDAKNIYAPAIDGDAENVVGVDIPYDVPQHSDLELDSSAMTPEEMLEVLWNKLEAELLPGYPLKAANF